MTEASAVPSVETALLCDDVRREISGKDIIIGVYGDEAIVPNFPVFMMFSLYLRVRFLEQGMFPTEFRVLGPSGQPLTANVKAPMMTTAANRIAMVHIAGLPIQVQSAGEVQFQWHPPGGEWETIQTLKVKQGEIKSGAVNVLHMSNA